MVRLNTDPDTDPDPKPWPMLSTSPFLLFKAPNFNFNSYSDPSFHFSMDPDPAAKKMLIQILDPAFKFKATAGLKLTRTKKDYSVDSTVGGTHL